MLNHAGHEQLRREPAWLGYRASGSVLTTSRSVDPAAAAMLVEIDRQRLESIAIHPPRRSDRTTGRL
jgi:hypothetical protein